MGVPMAEDVLDTRGLSCPLPVLKTRKRLLGMTAGQRLLVLANDPKTPQDLPHFCAEAGHRLLESGEGEGGWAFLIERC